MWMGPKWASWWWVWQNKLVNLPSMKTLTQQAYYQLILSLLFDGVHLNLYTWLEWKIIFKCDVSVHLLLKICHFWSILFKSVGGNTDQNQFSLYFFPKNPQDNVILDTFFLSSTDPLIWLFWNDKATYQSSIEALHHHVTAAMTGGRNNRVFSPWETELFLT